VSSRQLLAIFLLALLAGGTRWWLMRLQEANRQAGGLPDAHLEYTLDNFDLLVMDKQGLPSFQIESPHLEKTPVDGSVVLQQPRMYLFENGSKTWRIDAQSGWIREDGEEVLLLGKVLMTKGQDREQLIIRAQDLKIYPQQDLAQSSEPVDISRPGTVMAGVGLKARLDLEKFELLSEVKVRYEPLQSE
jgi:lipopolysaccharide export system protein LptC